MSIRDNLDISAYLVLGPENTLGRPVSDVVTQALDAGFTCIQVRSKVASAREIIALTGDAAQAIAQAGKTGQVALLIDDVLTAYSPHASRASLSTACMLARATSPSRSAANFWAQMPSWAFRPAARRCSSTSRPPT